MHDTGCSEKDAREYVKRLIDDTWKKMNKDIVMEKKPIITNFQTSATNLGRIALCFYQYGDGFGTPHGETKKNLVSVIIEPIPIP